MADIKPQVYKDPRPAEYFDRFYAYAATHRPGWVYDVARVLVTYVCLIVYRTWALGAENVRQTGPVILAPGFSVKASSFAIDTVDQNLVEYLTARSYDVWLFDYRAGIDENGRFRGIIQPTGLRPRFLERLSDQGVHFQPDLFQNESGSVPLAMRR